MLHESGRDFMGLLHDQGDTSTRSYAIAWVLAEAAYVDQKWGTERPDDDAQILVTGSDLTGHWGTAVTMYMHRAHVLGLQNPLGRQALMKGFSTYLAMAESMMRVFGNPPAPGVPSGVVQ